MKFRIVNISDAYTIVCKDMEIATVACLWGWRESTMAQQNAIRSPRRASAQKTCHVCGLDTKGHKIAECDICGRDAHLGCVTFKPRGKKPILAVCHAKLCRVKYRLMN